MKFMSSGGGSHASSKHLAQSAAEKAPARPPRVRKDDTQDLPSVPQQQTARPVQTRPAAGVQTAPASAGQARQNAQQRASAQASTARVYPQQNVQQRTPAQTSTARVYPQQNVQQRAPAQTSTARVYPQQNAQQRTPAQTSTARVYSQQNTPASTGRVYPQQGAAASTGRVNPQQRPISQTDRLGGSRPIPGSITAAAALPNTANGRAYVSSRAAEKQQQREQRARPARETRRQAAEPTQAELDALSRLPSAREDRRTYKKKRNPVRHLIRLAVVLVVLAGLYLFCVYTSVPFIANLRSLYIETAMTTMEHQWLATYFIPHSVIADTMAELDKLEANQDTMESDWSSYKAPTSTVLPSTQKSEPKPATPVTEDPGEDKPVEEEPEPVILEFWEDPEHEFWSVYTELDYNSFHEYALEHKDEMYSEEGYLFIDEADAQSKGTSILTTNGDPVLAIDAKNGIVLVRLNGAEYEGVMAIVKDPKQISMGVAKHLGSYGSKIATIAAENDAILAINASGFQDDDGLGNGGVVYGMLYSEGKKIQGTAGSNYKAIYFDSEYRLNVRSYKKDLDIYNGVEFKPALVINGEAAVTGSAGWGIQPRSAIGQTDDGTVLMIIVDGRQPTYSIGITVGELAKIFVKYGAVQAGNLDGGSSAVMYYNGRIITKPSGADKVNGRHLPDAFVVRARDVVYADKSGETSEPEE